MNDISNRSFFGGECESVLKVSIDMTNLIRPPSLVNSSTFDFLLFKKTHFNLANGKKITLIC